MTDERRRLQTALRAALLVLVVVWLFSAALRALLPYWVPLLALAAVELEFVVRAARERTRAPHTPDAPPPALAERQGPGAEDADLGWGEVVEDGDGGVRWVPPPPRPRRTRGGRALTVASAVAAASLVVVGIRDDAAATWSALPASDRAATQARLQREAAVIAGGPVRLRCDDGYAYTGVRSDALGVAFPRRGLAYLHPAICRTLHDMLAGDTSERAATGEALVVLAHEAVHLRPERREGVTECLALQEAVTLGRRLGLSEAVAARLARRRYLDALADRSLIRIEYRLAESCVDGGGLDLDPASDRFP